MMLTMSAHLHVTCGELHMLIVSSSCYVLFTLGTFAMAVQVDGNYYVVSKI